jgi:hypothetical protein
MNMWSDIIHGIYSKWVYSPPSKKSHWTTGGKEVIPSDLDLGDFATPKTLTIFGRGCLTLVPWLAKGALRDPIIHRLGRCTSGVLTTFIFDLLALPLMNLSISIVACMPSFCSLRRVLRTYFAGHPPYFFCVYSLRLLSMSKVLHCGRSNDPLISLLLGLGGDIHVDKLQAECRAGFYSSAIAIGSGMRLIWRHFWGALESWISAGPSQRE